MMTFEKATELVSRGRNKVSRKIANNTELRIVDLDTFAIRYHQTDIILIHRSGVHTLNSGGYRTVTTKSRMNDYAGANIRQKAGVWYVGDKTVFSDGIVMKGANVIKGGAKKLEQERQGLETKVRRYIDGFAKHVLKKGLQEPSNGDCWGCLMRDQNGNTVMGFDHILGHMDEKYYVPSLLVNAIRMQSPSDAGLAVNWHLIKREADAGLSSNLRRILRNYFRKIMPELLKTTPAVAA